MYKVTFKIDDSVLGIVFDSKEVNLDYHEKVWEYRTIVNTYKIKCYGQKSEDGEFLPKGVIVYRSNDEWENLDMQYVEIQEI